MSTRTGAGADAALRCAAAAVVLCLAATACGVPQDDAPRALEPGQVPVVSPRPSAVADDAGQGRVALYFVREGQVVPTVRRVERSASTEMLVELLFGGPVPEEGQAGLISVIPATLTVEQVRTSDGTAVITLAGPGAEVSRTPPLAFAQIVATLSPGRVRGVRFRLDGADLPVPRGDGSLTAAPLGRQDYASLLGPPPVAPAVGGREAPSPPAAAPTPAA